MNKSNKYFYKKYRNQNYYFIITDYGQINTENEFSDLQ